MNDIYKPIQMRDPDISEPTDDEEVDVEDDVEIPEEVEEIGEEDDDE